MIVVSLLFFLFFNTCPLVAMTTEISTIDQELITIRLHEYEKQAALRDRTVLHEAVLHGDYEIVVFLAQHISWNMRPDHDGFATMLTHEDGSGKSPLDYACYAFIDDRILDFFLRIIEYYEKKGECDTLWLQRFVCNPLIHSVAYCGNAEKMRLILQYYNDPNVLDKNNMSPLYCAIATSKFDCVRMLLACPTIKKNDIVGNSGLNALGWGLRLLNSGKTEYEAWTNDVMNAEESSFSHDLMDKSSRFGDYDELMQCVLYLIQQKDVDIFKETSNKPSVLAIAAKIKSLPLVQAILGRNDENWRDLFVEKNKQSCFLHFLLRFFDPAIFSYIVQFLKERDNNLLLSLLRQENNDNLVPIALAAKLNNMPALESIARSLGKKTFCDLVSLSNSAGESIFSMLAQEEGLPGRRAVIEMLALHAPEQFVVFLSQACTHGNHAVLDNILGTYIKKFLLMKMAENTVLPIHLLAGYLQRLHLSLASCSGETYNHMLHHYNSLLLCGVRMLELCSELEKIEPSKRIEQRLLILSGMKKIVQKRHELIREAKERESYVNQSLDCLADEFDSLEVSPKIKAAPHKASCSKKKKKNQKKNNKTKETKKSLTLPATTLAQSMVDSEPLAAFDECDLASEQHGQSWELVQKKYNKDRMQSFVIPSQLFSLQKIRREVLNMQAHTDILNDLSTSKTQEDEKSVEIMLMVKKRAEVLSLEHQELLKNLDYQALKKLDNATDWYHSFTQDVERVWAPFAHLSCCEQLTTKQQQLFFDSYGIFYDEYLWFVIDGSLGRQHGQFEFLVLKPSIFQVNRSERPKPLCTHRFFVPHA